MEMMTREHDGGAVEGKIAEVEEEIKKVNAKIEKIEGKLEPLEVKEETGSLNVKEEKRLDALREKEEQLREKELHLRKEKEQLRKKEEQLREKELLLLRTEEKPPIEVTLKPWIGYEEVAPLSVSVGSVDELQQRARQLVGIGEEVLIRLYYCELNENGVPKDKNRRTGLSNYESIRQAKAEGGGVVWICVGGSPSTSPQKKIPRSPFIKAEYANIAFDDLPELYEDSAYSIMAAQLKQSVRQDRVLLLMMAIPGSGKSRTVQSACKSVGVQHVRLKFLEGGRLDVVKECIRSLEGQTLSYDEWKNVLVPMFRKTFDAQLQEESGWRVLHVDDAQTLMSGKVVTRKEWSQEVGDPWDLVMPAACSALNGLMEDHKDVHCVVSGTNFFAPLTLNVGSEAKTMFVEIGGTFAPEWVMKNLVEKYFRIPEEFNSQMMAHVSYLCGNRRAIQHFFVALKNFVAPMREGDVLTADVLQQCRDRAFEGWSGPITAALGGANACSIQALALLLHPAAYGGVDIRGRVLRFAIDKFPDEIMRYALAGGLNIAVNGDKVSVNFPVGCVWDYLCQRASGALDAASVQELDAFITVAKSIETDLGHLFERLLACELSMLRLTGPCPFYSLLDHVWRGDGELVPDPLVFGRPFVYESRIRTIAWEAHQIYCVKEEASAKGERDVDVGFPMLLCKDDTPPVTVRCMCELKKGYTAAELWKLCWAYFDKMSKGSHDDVIVCFIASKPFLESEPRDSPSEKSINAFNSRSNCLDLMDRHPRFLAIDNLELEDRSLFPLRALFNCKEVELDVEEIATGVEGLYVGTPAKTK